MTQTRYQASIREILTEVRPDIILSPNVDLIVDGLIDSVDIIEIVVQIEQRFALSIKMEDIDPKYFKNEDTLSTLVDHYLNDKK